MKGKNDFYKIVALNSLVLLILRFLEIALVLLNFPFPQNFVRSEILGFGYDLVVCNALLAVMYPLYVSVWRYSEKFARILAFFSIAVMAILHFFILKYFLYQLVPLDTALFQYSSSEIFFTVTTSDIDFNKTIVLLFGVIAFISIVYYFMIRAKWSRKLIVIFYFVLIIVWPLWGILKLTVTQPINRFTQNKSVYFYGRSMALLFDSNVEMIDYTKEDAVDFQKLSPSKKYLNDAYPILYQRDTTNVLKPYFNRFERSPNVVILIIEGLNNDFIHPYKGVDLMPFLSQLKDRSLYWSRCFTLGERSFAVVPSLTGGLPYGERGFTLLDQLPLHLSLVSVLDANDYYTSFFDGQGSWFHQKGRYFKYNNIDMVFDNRDFSEEYQKIIVGDDHFFWGYNDKDLLNQSLTVIDTLPQKKRLDMYFTGTSHSPFAISEQKFYDERFERIIESLNGEETITYFNKYKKYIQSLLFVDDALRDFFDEYKKRPEYENTLFVITGDHPMSEIPPANELKKYHVPLVFYSPRLKRVHEFTSVVSHFDVPETLFPFLSDYEVKIPSFSSGLGNPLNTVSGDNRAKVAFMNDNREIVDYYSNGYFISADRLFKVDHQFSLIEEDNAEMYKRLRLELDAFKRTNLEVSLNDRIIPRSLYYKGLSYKEIHDKSDAIYRKQFDSEYFTLLKTEVKSGSNLLYDLSFDFNALVDDQFSIVVQLSNAKDSILFWKGIHLSRKTDRYKENIELPRIESDDSILFFNSYFWNQNKIKFEFDSVKVVLYEQ